MSERPDPSNTEAMQWGTLLPCLVDAVFDRHPDLDWLDAYLEWLYGDQVTG